MSDRIRTMQNSRVRGAIVAACAGLATTMCACSGDSGMAVDDGGPDTSTMDASGTDGAANDARPAADSGAADSASNDVTARDASVDAPGIDAMTADATQDSAPGEASIDSAAPSDAAADTGSEAGPDAAPPAALQMCLLFDGEYQITTDAAGCATQTSSSCTDRAGNWDSDFNANFGIGSASTDCRISGMFPTDFTQATDYQNDLIAWTLQFFGCPFSPDVDAGPYGFGLIPRIHAGQHFTMGDLQLLSAYWVQAVQASLLAPCSAPGGCSTSTVTGPLPPLTQSDGGQQGQLDQVNAMLAYLMGQVPGINPSTTTYLYDSCTVDAGSDAPSDAGGGD